jgi:hypothetical protein
MLRSFAPAIDNVRLHWNRWLLREINPLSPYVPQLIHRIRELEDKLPKITS